MADLKPRPEPFPRRAARSPLAGAAAAVRSTRVPATAAMLCATLVLATAAAAQVGLGAERYEVTITPPKRPGSEAAVGEPAPPDGAAAKTADQAPASSGSPPPEDDNYKLGATGDATKTASPPSASAPGSAPARSAEPAATRSAPTGPLHTLQVGAYRQRKSAGSMRDKLSASFADVEIVEVQSGGEPLYRVNVGRLPRGGALDDLKKRLVAAGYPAFEVAAPPTSAGD
jgi:hypothetical protein